jgi:hypothetical protein
MQYFMLIDYTINIEEEGTFNLIVCQWVMQITSRLWDQ